MLAISPNIALIQTCREQAAEQLRIVGCNLLNSLPESFAQLTQLRTLTFFNCSNSNHWEDICGYPLQLPNLETLTFYNSYFPPEKVKHFVQQLPALKQLHLIKSLSRYYQPPRPEEWAWLDELVGLESLSLESTGYNFVFSLIKSWSAVFPNLKALSFVGTNFGWNEISVNTLDFFKFFPNLERVFLGDLPVSNTYERKVMLNELLVHCPKLRFISTSYKYTAHDSGRIVEWLKKPDNILEWAFSEKENLQSCDDLSRLETENAHNPPSILRFSGSLSWKLNQKLALFPIDKVVGLELTEIEYVSSCNLRPKSVHIVNSVKQFPQIAQFLNQLPHLECLEWTDITVNSAVPLAAIANTLNWGFLKRLKHLHLEVKSWKFSGFSVADFLDLVCNTTQRLETLFLDGEIIKNKPLSERILQLSELKHLNILKPIPSLPNFLHQFPNLNQLSLPYELFKTFPAEFLSLAQSTKPISLHLNTFGKRLPPSILDDLPGFLQELRAIPAAERADFYQLFQNWEFGKDFEVEKLQKNRFFKTKPILQHTLLALEWKIQSAEIFKPRKSLLRAGQTLFLEGDFKQKKATFCQYLTELGFKISDTYEPAQIDAFILGANRFLPADWQESSYQIHTENELLDWINLQASKYLATEEATEPEMIQNLLSLLCSNELPNTILACELMETGGVPKNKRLLTQILIIIRHTNFFYSANAESEAEKSIRKRLKHLFKPAVSPAFFKVSQASPHPLQRIKMSMSMFKDFFELWASFGEIDHLWLLAYVLKHCTDEDKTRGEAYRDKFLSITEQNALSKLT